MHRFVYTDIILMYIYIYVGMDVYVYVRFLLYQKDFTKRKILQKSTSKHDNNKNDSTIKRRDRK
jgi:hypothetical protein